MSIADTLYHKWAEAGFFILMFLGFILAILLKSPTMSYIVIVLAGLMAGHLWFEKLGHQHIFPYFLIIVGFLFGYLVGSFDANRKILLILFIVSWIFSYLIHKKGIVKTW